MLVKVLILVIILVSNTYIKFMCPEKTGVCVCVCVCVCMCVQDSSFGEYGNILS